MNSIYNYNWNDDLAAIFEAKLNGAIDNQEPLIFKRYF